MMDIKTYLYNTLTKSVDEFVPNEEGKVAMYTCGPTVYHFAHIGNLRSYIMEDVLEKYLRYVGYDVKRVMNITDVGHLTSDGDTGEDKMLKGAKREHKTVMDIARFYTDAFMADCEKLSIKRPDVVETAETKYFKENGDGLKHPYSKALFQALPQNGFHLEKCPECGLSSAVWKVDEKEMRCECGRS